MKKINKVILEIYSDRKQILFLSFLALLEYLTKDLGVVNTEVQYATMGWIAVGTAVLGAGVSIWSTNKNAGLAEDAATTAEKERKAQQDKLDKQKEEYKAMKFKNPFTDMENVYEDLTVNQQQAEFQAQQGAQQRANIMQGLRGAAGASGIAGLAQSLAGQGALQTQQISASIGAQEAANQQLAAKGAGAVQLAERQGDQWVQQAEMDRQATLLGMQMGQTTGANLAQQQAQANQMNAQIAQTQALVSGISGIASAAMSSYNPSGSTTNPRLADPNATNDTNPLYDEYGNWLGNPLDDPNLGITDLTLKKGS